MSGGDTKPIKRCAVDGVRHLLYQGSSVGRAGEHLFLSVLKNTASANTNKKKVMELLIPVS